MLVLQKCALMKRVAHQTIVMQYILELAKQLDRDPRTCAPGFFVRLVETIYSTIIDTSPIVLDMSNVLLFVPVYKR